VAKMYIIMHIAVVTDGWLNIAVSTLILYDLSME